jgi:hypothetical protein
MRCERGAVEKAVWGVLAAAIAALAAGNAWGASPATERQTREEAIRSIPFQELTGETRAKLERVVGSPSIYRRMPAQLIDCDPDMYLFLVRYPEVIVSIWRLMEITNVSVQRTGPFSVKTFDGVSTNSHIELVYGTRDTHVVYAEGVYEGPLFKRKVTGRCVLVLKSGYGRGEDGRSKINNQLDMFIQIDNLGAEIVAKTLQPMVGRTADLNFAESAGFLEQLNKAAETDAETVQRLSGRLKEVEPSVREQFARLAAVVSERSRPEQPASAETPLSPGAPGGAE